MITKNYLDRSTGSSTSHILGSSAYGGSSAYELMAIRIVCKLSSRFKSSPKIWANNLVFEKANFSHQECDLLSLYRIPF